MSNHLGKVDMCYGNYCKEKALFEDQRPNSEDNWSWAKLEETHPRERYSTYYVFNSQHRLGTLISALHSITEIIFNLIYDKPVIFFYSC